MEGEKCDLFTLKMILTHLSLCDQLQFLRCNLCDGHLVTLVMDHCTLVIAVLFLKPRPQVTLHQIKSIHHTTYHYVNRGPSNYFQMAQTRLKWCFTEHLWLSNLQGYTYHHVAISSHGHFSSQFVHLLFP